MAESWGISGMKSGVYKEFGNRYASAASSIPYCLSPGPGARARLPRILNWANAVFRLLASLKLAVTMIVLLAAVLAVATFIESDQGRECARWYVYTTDWFMALLGMLGVNILAATLIRFPWKPRQIGFVVTHCGLLILLGRVDRDVPLRDRCDARSGARGNERAKSLSVSTNRFAVQWQSLPNQPDRPVSAFLVPSRTCRLAGRQKPTAGGDQRHRTPRDALSGPCPAVGGVDGRDGRQWHRGVEVFARGAGYRRRTTEQWLTASRFGGSTAVGSAKVEFRQADADTMVDDFLHPPASDGLDPQGLLSIHYQGQVEHVPVSKNLGKKILWKAARRSRSPPICPTPNSRPTVPSNVGPMPVHPVLDLEGLSAGRKGSGPPIRPALVRQSRRHAGSSVAR